MGTVSERIVSCCTSTFPCLRQKQPEEPPVKQNPKKEDIVVFQNKHALEQMISEHPQPVSQSKTVSQFVALFDYSKRTAEDLSFHTGDKLQLLQKYDTDWWFVKALTGVSANKEGYVPANYIATVESLDAEPWYFADTKRLDAEKLLQAEGNKHGAFLIRHCESQAGELSLSVLDGGNVKHYKIRREDNGHYYISKSRHFPTLKELVEHYSKQEDGLCVRLRQPCKKAEAPQTHGLSYSTVDQWEIPRSSIRLLRKLGAGKFGEVHEGLWNNTTSVAVKTLKPEDRGARLRVPDQIEMAAQVAAGMAYLELQNYIHRDLAARNVLVGENNVCKVADFGLARVFNRENNNCYNEDEENIYEATEGTYFLVKWTAPEAIRENKFTIKSDVWSFGILLYEIMTFGQMPYPTLTNAQVVVKLGTGYRMSCPPLCPKMIYDIMVECWKETPAERPTFETLQWKLEEYSDLDVSSYDDANRY
ncbi:tyrosine-protein kinase FRK-like [Astyanax mexicanus]|uniref:tyrosine-protein kinase FRK-like n=1 Tax=Astyanax mexicanus TaxID=7994 RepID=UPI0020CB2560|nr:tyrosine-protein kinase FRK-like [Astyanax mexicanus]